MSIRPIDMQVIIPKTSEITKIQHTELHRPGTEQQQFANQLNKQVLQNQKQVTDSDKTGKTIKEDENKKKKDKQKKKKNGNDIIDEKGNNKQDISSTSIFDIEI